MRTSLLAYLLLAWTMTHPAAGAEAFPREWFSGSEQQRALHDDLVGKPAPNLDLADWLDGKALTAKDLAKKIVVIQFWATWCGPCLASIPTSNEIAGTYRDQGVVVLGVCSSSRGQERMAEVAKQHRIAYPVARDPQVASATAWRVQFWPTYAIIDRAGLVRAVGIRRDKLRDAIDQLLQEQPPGKEKAKEAAAEKLPQPLDESIPDDWREGDDERKAMLRELEAGPLPTLELSDWVNSPGVDLSSLKGKVVLLHFWTTKPGTGLRGMSKTRDLARRYQREGLAIIGIYAGGDLATYKEAVAKHPVDYPVAYDAQGNSIAAFKVNDFPDYHLIDRTGRLRIADCSEYYLQIATRKLLRETIAEDSAAAEKPTNEP